MFLQRPEALAPHATKLGLRRGDGLALLSWLLELVGEPDATEWLEQARASVAQPASAR